MTKKEQLIQQIQSYVPFNEQEERDKESILWFLLHNQDAFERSNTMAHMTASAWVVNETFDKTLMCYHNIYHSWSWLGGHSDGNEDLLSVAVQEVKEESSLNDVIPVSSDIYSLEVLTVDGHIKRGKYVSSHLHMNVTYLLQASEKEFIKPKPDENKAVRWFTFQEALQASTEPWFVEHIYSKLIDKLKVLPVKK